MNSVENNLIREFEDSLALRFSNNVLGNFEISKKDIYSHLQVLTGVTYLLSRNIKGQPLHMVFIEAISQLTSSHLGGLKNNEFDKVYLKVVIKESIDLLTVLKNTMIKSMEHMSYCFKDEIQIIEDFLREN